MRQKIVLLGAILVLLLSSSAFSLNGYLILERQIIHVSGASTSSDESSSSASKSSSKSRSRSKGSSSRTGSSSSDFVIPAEPVQRYGAFTPEEEKNLKIEITDIDGHTFSANMMEQGVDNILKINTGTGKFTLKISSLTSIEFGKKNLGRQKVSVSLKDGSIVAGTIDYKTVFEFTGKDGITVAYADSLRRILISRP